MKPFQRSHEGHAAGRIPPSQCEQLGTTKPTSSLPGVSSKGRESLVSSQLSGTKADLEAAEKSHD